MQNCFCQRLRLNFAGTPIMGMKWELYIGHKLAVLYRKLSLKSQQAYDACILHDLKNYFVDMRYMLDGRLMFTEEQGVLTKEYYETIASPSWLTETSRQVSDFIKYAESTIPFVIKTTRFSGNRYNTC